MEKRLIAIFAIIIAFCSCQPRVITQIKTEYVYRDRVQVDTTFIHDSIHLKEYVKGDTVRIIEYRDCYKYQYKFIHDTTAVHDTTVVETTKEVKVEKPLKWHERSRLWAFPLLLGLVAWAYRKTLWKWLKLILRM